MKNVRLDAYWIILRCEKLGNLGIMDPTNFINTFFGCADEMGYF